MLGEATRNRFKVLMIGVNRLVRDNVRVLLGTLGCGCVIGSSLGDSPALLQNARPDVAVLDQQLLNSTPPGILTAFHKVFFKLRGRTVLLTREDGAAETLKVLDAYSIPKVSVDLVFEQLWPCLDSLLHRSGAPSVQNARLAFDSLLQPVPAGIRSAQPADRTLLYEAGEVMVDRLSLELPDFSSSTQGIQD